MKTKLFTLLLAVAASVGTMFANQVWPIIMDETTFATCNSDSTVVADFRPNYDDRFRYIWTDTYDSLGAAGPNFMGNTDGYVSLRVGSQGWAGAGFCLTENGNSWQAAEQLRAAIVANPDNYYLHMAIKSTDNYSHCFYLFDTEATKFELGNHSVYNGPVYSDFTRDGAWHEFYIPMSTYASALASTTCNAGTYIFVMLSEGVSGAMLDLDAVYICDEEFMNTAFGYRHVQIGDLYYNLDATNQTAEVTSQSKSTSNYMGLTTAIIPASVEYNSVAYSVTSIRNSAFSGCSGLTSVTIPNSVTSIGEGAFCGCSGLTSMTIGNSVTSIGSSAFDGCTGLTSVIWNAKNYADFASNNTPFYADYYDKEWGYQIQFDLRPQITSFTFGNEVKYIPANLCNGMSNLTSVTIPNSVTSIGEYAFSNCSGLTSVTIGNSVTSIGNSAFRHCTGLTSVTIPNSVTSIGESAFAYCTGLTSVTIGNSVTSIGSYAFCDCSGLTSVTIGNSVTSIGNCAFSRCTGLTSIEIPNSVTSIGGSAFYGCTGLTSVTIGNSVTGIGREAFDGCTGLTSMEAPAGFFDVPEGSWPYCTKILNHVTVNGGELTENALLFINRSYKTLQTLDVSGVTNTEFADEAFKGCYNLQQLVLPEGLQKVSYMMVAGCVNLQSINIPASVEEIEQRAFEDCRSIQTITFGGAPAGAPGRFNAPAASASQLRRIGNWAFYNAHELQDLDIPEGVTEIGDGAFYGCTYLEEMVLPSSVQTIGDNTFALCAKLQKITVNSVTPPSIQAKTFFDVKRQIPVYVPDEAVSAYENDTYWQEFDIQGASQMPTGIDNIDSSSLQGGDRGRLILRDGQIFILRGEKVYTVTGQEVR